VKRRLIRSLLRMRPCDALFGLALGLTLLFAVQVGFYAVR
jgi:hypothetical protein